MALLTLKNIERTGDSGTAALKNAGDLFNRAFSQFTGAAQTVDAGVKARHKEAVDVNTQDLLQKLRSVNDPNAVADVQANFLGSADAEFGNKFNRNTIADAVNNLNTRVESDAQAAFERDKAQKTRAFEDVFSKLNTTGLAPAAPADSNVNTVLSRMDRLQAIDAELSNRPDITPAQRKLARERLQNDFDLQSEKLAARLLDSVNPDTGKKLTDEQVSNIFAQYGIAPGAVANVRTKRDADTGADVIKAENKRQQLRNEAITDFKIKEEYKEDLATKSPTYVLKAVTDTVNAFVEENSSLNWGENDRQMATKAVYSAVQRDVPLKDALSIFMSTHDNNDFDASHQNAYQNNIAKYITEKQLEKLKNTQKAK